MEPIKIGLISVSDRASTGEYEDRGIPGLKSWLDSAILNPITYIERVIPDDQSTIEETLIDLTDREKCPLILTTGGTGPYPRDVTPDATLAIADRVMQGFGEQMRQISLNFVPTAILSRQEGVIRKESLIINLPGQPKAIAETLGGLRNKEGDVIVSGIFASVPFCIDALNGPYLETDPTISKTFRPKGA